MKNKIIVKSHNILSFDEQVKNKQRKRKTKNEDN